jgi:phosphoglycolate phosphatase
MKTLIFDFDGTLADSFTTLLDVFEEIMHRPQRLTLKEIENLRGQKLKYILRYLRIKSWQVPRLAIQGKKAMSNRIADIKPFNGIPEAIKELKAAGFDMYILSSNSPENIRIFLAANGMEDNFRNIYGNVGLRGKAAALKKVVKAERLNKNNCIYIGDELRDIDAARKIRIAVASVSWGFSTPEVLKEANPKGLVNNPKHLLKILQTL